MLSLANIFTNNIMWRITILLAVYLLLVFPTVNPLDCQVTIKNGTINGYITSTLNPHKKVCAYTSIPFATPPVGPLRFEAPLPVAQGWDTLNATTFPNRCPQIGTPPSRVQVSEDCLYLNVYQPQVTIEGSGLPVMIWIHGGAFIIGSSYIFTSTKLLARGDVILVVIHYRLGLLGFLSTGDELIPGNNGLKDQALAIRWVHENIKAFGGDPGRTTIFGESAGAASVIYQMISPLSNGLIHGAIAQSGTALSFWAIDRNPEKSAKEMAQHLSCPVTNKLEMISCLRKLSWQFIIKKQKEFMLEGFETMKFAQATTTPVIEPKNSAGAFITEDPEVILKSGEIPDIPLVIGSNKHEGSFILGILYMAKIGPQNLSTNADYMKSQRLPDIFKFVGVQDPDLVASSVENEFLSGVNRSSWKDSMPSLVDAVSVLVFKKAIMTTADILSGRGRKVYLYSFEHHSRNSIFPWIIPGYHKIPVEHGVAHGDDLFYLFNIPAVLSPEDKYFSKIFSDMWLNFAIFGTPTPFPDKKFEAWLPYDSKDESFMKLNVTPTLQHGYRNSWRPNGFEWN